MGEAVQEQVITITCSCSILLCVDPPFLPNAVHYVHRTLQGILTCHNIYTLCVHGYADTHFHAHIILYGPNYWFKYLIFSLLNRQDKFNDRQHSELHMVRTELMLVEFKTSVVRDRSVAPDYRTSMQATAIDPFTKVLPLLHKSGC